MPNESTQFLGQTYHYTDQVLTPRLETEWLVLLVSQNIGMSPLDRILDIGTGSGIIAGSLAKKFPRIPIEASDISLDSLQIASQNFQSLWLSVSLVQSDLLEYWISGSDPLGDVCIVANLPYVGRNEVVGEDVIQHDPDIAVFAEEDGLALIRRLIREAELLHHRCKSLRLFLEHGPTQAEKIKDISRLHWISESFPDYSLKIRYTRLTYGSSK